MYMAVSSNNIKDENNNAENGIIIDTSNISSSATEAEKKVEYQKWLGDAQSTETPIDPSDANSIAHNSELIEDIDAQTYGNTVVVKVKGNWSELQETSSMKEENKKVIPLELDITALKIASGTDKVYILNTANPSNNWGLMKYDKDYNKTILYLGCSYDAETPYKDLYVTKSSVAPTDKDINKLTTPYIHYIIEFVD